VRAGVLHVAVSGGTWATQLTFFRTELLRRVRASGAAVRDIVFRVGLPPGEAALAATASAEESPRPASAQELAAAAAVAQGAGAFGPSVSRLYLAAARRQRRHGPR